MDQKKFQSLLKYYLSCMDAEEATHLKLRKNQEYRTYIFASRDEKEQIFSQDLPQLEIAITDARQNKFIEQRAPNAETLIDLYYGFPVFVDDKDMLSPLFFVEVEARFSNAQTLRLLPKINSLCINRIHLIKLYDAEETQRICEELEGEFGSFEARMSAAKVYIPSLNQTDAKDWIAAPILFRTNFNNARSGLRYDLTYLLKDKDVLTKDTALKYVPQYSLGQYRLDFMLHGSSGDRYNLEVDGDIHLTAESVQHDERRDAYVINQGFRIIRMTARDIFHNSEIIKERLMRI